MKFINLFLFLILIVFPLNVEAQLLHRDWASYFGGNLTTITQVESDNAGEFIYIIGFTADSNLATTGVHKQIFDPINTPDPSTLSLFSWKTDAFLAKFDNEGNRIWCTYLGGQYQEMMPVLQIDNSGNPIIVGMTKSLENIATTGSFIDTKTDTISFSYFVMKFNPNGEKLWGTYYDTTSSNENLIVATLATDSYDNIYLGGICKSSSSNIATIGAYRPSYNGGDYDGFVAKFDKYGNRLWATYIGDLGDDVVGGITVNSDNYLYIMGSTTSLNNIGTTGRYQEFPLNDTIVNYFAMRLHPITGNKVWGTYISTYNPGLNLHNINSDKNGNFFVSGRAYYGTTLPTIENIATTGTHKTVYSGMTDMVLMKFDSTGNKSWGTYYGGTDYENNSYNSSGLLYSVTMNYPTIGLSADGKNVVIAGYTSSTNGIDEAGCGYVPTTSKREGFIANFNGANGQLHWNSYFDAEINDIEIDESNPQSLQIYFATRTHIDSLATPGSFKENKTGLLTAGLFGKLYVACPLATPSISYSSPQLTIDGDYESYTWYHNGMAVSTGDSDSYAPGADTTGYYYAMVEKCGCDYFTDTFYFDDIGIRQLDFERHFHLYPNPTTDQVRLEVLDASTNISAADIQVYNLLGQLQTVQISQPTATNFSIGMQQLPAGAYLLQVRNTKGIWTKQVVKW